MKDISKDLLQIVKEVKNELSLKAKSLSSHDSFTTISQSNINYINKRIINLEEQIDEINTLSKSKPDVLLNFKKRASEIWVEIEKLG